MDSVLLSQVDPVWWFVAAETAVMALALAFFFAQLKKLKSQQALWESRFTALQEQTQSDLLAIGQRVLEADKLLRRFNDRLDSMENTQPAETHYGQLEALLTKSVARDDEVSTAEAELLSLLRRQSQSS